MLEESEWKRSSSGDAQGREDEEEGRKTERERVRGRRWSEIGRDGTGTGEEELCFATGAKTRTPAWGEIFGEDFPCFQQEMMMKDRARERRAHQRRLGVEVEGEGRQRRRRVGRADGNRSVLEEERGRVCWHRDWIREACGATERAR